MLCCVSVQGGKLVLRLQLISSRCGMWSGSAGPSATSADEADHITDVTHSAPGGFAGSDRRKGRNRKCSLGRLNEVAPLADLTSSLSNTTSP